MRRAASGSATSGMAASGSAGRCSLQAALSAAVARELI